MEYGEAITGQSLDRAVALALEGSRRHPDRPLADVAADAVAHTYCVCVTDGQDAAEQRFSGVHRTLVEQVISRLSADPGRAADGLPASPIRQRRGK